MSLKRYNLAQFNFWNQLLSGDTVDEHHSPDSARHPVHFLPHSTTKKWLYHYHWITIANSSHCWLNVKLPIQHLKMCTISPHLAFWQEHPAGSLCVCKYPQLHCCLSLLRCSFRHSQSLQLTPHYSPFLSLHLHLLLSSLSFAPFLSGLSLNLHPRPHFRSIYWLSFTFSSTAFPPGAQQLFFLTLLLFYSFQLSWLLFSLLISLSCSFLCLNSPHWCSSLVFPPTLSPSAFSSYFLNV